MLPSPAASQLPTLRQRRIWFFRLACIALALAPFLIAELYLRVTQRVDSADLSVDPIFDAVEPAPLFVVSPDGHRMIIPESRINFFRPASFELHKPGDVRRVFVLGGSTVQGRPYETETAFAKWAELRLASADPEHRYEVVNCGGVSYASYRLAIILKEILTYSPDAIVLYTGHNEFLEERSYNTVGRDANLLERLARRSQLVQAIRERLVAADSADRQELSPDLRTRLDLIDGMQRYIRDDRWRDGVVEHFHITLDRMIRMCHVADVPLVLCVPTSDLVRTPPFKVASLATDGESHDTFDKQWAIAQDDGATETQRLNACKNCLEIDPRHAGSHYVAGQIYINQQNLAKARFHLTAARDDDVCPLRATTPIIETILRLADEHKIRPIRCDELFDRSDLMQRPISDGIPDPHRFVDHIHPSISGHQEIAKVVSDRLLEIFVVKPSSTAEQDYQRIALEQLSTLDETYFARGKQRLEGLRNWAAGRAGRLTVDTQ
ncbi:MAG: SGNH/GDSL hydrolase family protein [Planctomycetales bacterium]|nr:SGNH/GDSL hydrolase family protein [Planctomycetales bacterium]